MKVKLSLKQLSSCGNFPAKRDPCRGGIEHGHKRQFYTDGRVARALLFIISSIAAKIRDALFRLRSVLPGDRIQELRRIIREQFPEWV